MKVNIPLLTLLFVCFINSSFSSAEVLNKTVAKVSDVTQNGDSASNALIELGKRLFFDKRLSGDSSIACSDCHQPQYGFTHRTALSPGYPGNKHFRNAPSLINTALKTRWLHDGRIATNLNDVVREMLTEDYIMNMDMRLMQERLKQDLNYVALFAKAGLGEPSNSGVRKAIPAFLAVLKSTKNNYDLNKLNKQARQGKQLFFGKAGCSQCHSGHLYTDELPHNTGVPENLSVFLDPLSHQTFIAFNMFMGVSDYMSLKRDIGAGVLTHKADGSDRGKFITPSLRELNYTAPYMHNGIFNTLDEVVSFYNKGGGKDRYLDKKIKPLGLTKVEQKALVSFLKSLSSSVDIAKKYTNQEHQYSYHLIEKWQDKEN
ncbi:cytochrome-c peroxidase [Spartinivicinus poritis]|uniref:Photosynthetic protein synthase I n=1 Tax=Spartinivicinus poritis TaxID=2994640 RepID=A0ABT5U7I8_9GAMM|nr:cytochrome c peroxidase [Spartinivicinus sp. A2-2]MDE1461398.1 photosynthetic protein synthase I [Spartinivicinus sp. A2-2]